MWKPLLKILDPTELTQAMDETIHLWQTLLEYKDWHPDSVTDLRHHIHAIQSIIATHALAHLQNKTDETRKA